MASQKRNEYLDVVDSESDHVSDTPSDIPEESRTARPSHRTFRKRKLSENSSVTESDSESEPAINNFTPDPAPISEDEIQQVQPDRAKPRTTPLRSSKPSKDPPNKKSKPGIIYISRIPPYLKPQTLRHLFSIHGTITNLFLTPEAPSVYHTRVHTHHGNKKRQYIDGWVEFKHKRHAHACVDALNGQTTAQGLGIGGIGGRKGGKGRWYRDDVWSLRYLRGFKWGDLMQAAQAEEREREERVRVGVMREKRERRAFERGVQGAKVEETRRRKRVKKMGMGEALGVVDGEDERKEEATMAEDGRKAFRQNEVWKPKGKGSKQPDEVTRVLSQIF